MIDKFSRQGLRRVVAALALSTLSSTLLAEQVLRRGNGAEPSTLDPQISEGVPSSHIQRDLFEGLLAEDSNGDLVPGIAESWEISDDSLTYTFALRDAQWSNGDPVKASDFVYAWRRAVDPSIGSNYSFLLYPVKNAQAISKGEIKDIEQLGIQAINDTTLQVQLEEPTPYFLGMITHSIAMPVHPATVEAHGDRWTRAENIVSNGAFTMADWVPQSNITLVRNPSYWDAEAVQLDKVIYFPVEDQNAELKMYRAGELDWTYELPNDQIKWVRENLSDEMVISNYLGTYYYGFNTLKPPFDDIRVRRALSLAIDREILTDKIVTAGEVPAYSMVVPGVNGYKPALVDFIDMPMSQRRKEAKRLIAEAGFNSDNPLSIEVLYNTSENHKKIAVAIASMWKSALGAQVTLKNQEWKVYLETRKLKTDTQVFRAGWIGDYNDPNTFLELWLPDSGLNDVSFKDDSYAELLGKSVNATSFTERMEAMHAAERRFSDSHSIAPIYHYVTKRVVKPYVKGWQPGNVMDHLRSKYISIESAM